MTCKEIAESSGVDIKFVRLAAKAKGFEIPRGRKPTQFGKKDSISIASEAKKLAAAEAKEKATKKAEKANYKKSFRNQ